MSSSIAMIILNYNSENETMSLANSLLKWKIDNFHIVIVDNCSQQGSFNKIKSEYSNHPNDNITVIRTDRNGGYSYGNNIGVEYAIEQYHCEYIAIANPDILINENTFIRLMETFQINDRIAMCAPVMKNSEGNYDVCSLKIPEYTDDLYACFHDRYPDNLRSYQYDYLENQKEMIMTEMLPGSFFVIRAKILQKVDLFDTNVFLFCEERILGRKLKEAGFFLILRQDLFFDHFHSTTIKRELDIIKTEKILWDSRLYYQKTYNKINSVKEDILKIGISYYLRRLNFLFMYGKIKRIICRKN